MSDYDSDFENDYDDFDAGFESDEKETTNGLDDTTDAISAAAEILMTGGSSSGSSREGRSISVRDVDASGKPEYSTNGKEADTPAHMTNRSAPDGSATQRVQNAQYVMQQAERAIADIEDRVRNNEMSQQEAAQAVDYARGVWAANQIQALQAEKDALVDQQWLSNQVDAVRREHADIWDDPQKRAEYQQKAVDYLGSIGYSAAELSEAGAREMNVVLSLLKTQQENEKLKAENNRHRTQNRRRKQAQGRGRRDMQAGARTKNSASVTDEVARIILGTGAKR